MPPPTGEDVATVNAAAAAELKAELEKRKAAASASASSSSTATTAERRKPSSKTEAPPVPAVSSASEPVVASRRFGPTTFDAMIASEDARREALGLCVCVCI